MTNGRPRGARSTLAATIVGHPTKESDRAVEAIFLGLLQRQRPNVAWYLVGERA